MEKKIRRTIEDMIEELENWDCNKIENLPFLVMTLLRQAQYLLILTTAPKGFNTELEAFEDYTIEDAEDEYRRDNDTTTSNT